MSIGNDYQAYGWSSQTGLPIHGKKACPRCNSTDIHWPASSITEIDGQYLQADMYGALGFLTYSSWWCFTCHRVFETPTLLSDVPGLENLVISPSGVPSGDF
jgi:hypothetical protein